MNKPRIDIVRYSIRKKLQTYLSFLLQNDPDNRPDLEEALELCDQALQGASSQDVCQRFACNTASEADSPKGQTTHFNFCF